MGSPDISDWQDIATAYLDSLVSQKHLITQVLGVDEVWIMLQ